MHQQLLFYKCTIFSLSSNINLTTHNTTDTHTLINSLTNAKNTYKTNDLAQFMMILFRVQKIRADFPLLPSKL